MFMLIKYAARKLNLENSANKLMRASVILIPVLQKHLHHASRLLFAGLDVVLLKMVIAMIIIQEDYAQVRV
jgi:hypothetical protein